MEIGVQQYAKFQVPRPCSVLVNRKKADAIQMEMPCESVIDTGLYRGLSRYNTPSWYLGSGPSIVVGSFRLELTFSRGPMDCQPYPGDALTLNRPRVGTKKSPAAELHDCVDLKAFEFECQHEQRPMPG